MKLNGDRLRSLRAQKGLSQGDLAKMSDVHPKTIYRAENGSPVDQETAAFIADALGVPAQSLRNEDAPAHSDTAGEVIHLPCRSGRRLVEKMTEVFNFTFELDVEPTGANVDAVEAFQEVLKHMLRDPRNAEAHREGRQTDLRLAAEAQDAIAALTEHGLIAYLGVFSSYQELDRVLMNDGDYHAPGRIALDCVLHAHVVISEQDVSHLRRVHDAHIENQDPSVLEGGTAIFRGWRVQDWPDAAFNVD